MYEVKGHLIGGEWVQTPDGVERKEFEVHDRTTDELIAHVPEACDEQIGEAMANANRIWREGSWHRRTSLVHRAECMLRAAQIAERRREEIVDAMLAECGKTRVECQADVTEGIHMLQAAYARGRLGRVGEVVRGEHPDRWSEVQHVPIGPCVAIAPWNFPFALPIWLTAVPLVAGNPVILKPAEQTPLCAQLLAEIYAEAGVPAGVFQMLQGMGETVGEKLVMDPRVARVLFTGSSEVAAHLTKLQAELFPHRLPMVAECGGKNVIGVMPMRNIEDFDMAAKAVAMSITRTSGQRCVSCSRVVVHEKAMDAFLSRLTHELAKQVIGDSRRPAVTMGPLIDGRAANRWEDLREEARQLELKPVYDSKVSEAFASAGNWAAPSVWVQPRDDEHRFQREEFFVPFAVVIQVGSFDEMIDVMNATDCGLAAGLFSDNPRDLARFETEVDAGILYENMGIIGAEVQLPFGGEKSSGRGMASADSLWAAVTRERAITRNVGYTLPFAQGLK